jgi:hypothetical protein
VAGRPIVTLLIFSRPIGQFTKEHLPNPLQRLRTAELPVGTFNFDLQPYLAPLEQAVEQAEQKQAVEQAEESTLKEQPSKNQPPQPGEPPARSAGNRSQASRERQKAAISRT